MRTSRVCSVLLIVLWVAMVVMPVTIEGARPLCGEFSGANHILELYPTAFKTVKNEMFTWIGRLEEGPSPKGPGH
ncbi:hypothetical protein AMTRI_Chr06g177880 [Amborella trichopoda]